MSEIKIQRREHAKLIKVLKAAQRTHNVVLVEGARQVGKTTLVRMALNEFEAPIFELNLETNELLRFEIDRTNSFAEFRGLLEVELKLPRDGDFLLFIDEAQESDRLGQYVRSMKEEWTTGQFILSGSSMKRLFREGTRVPVGRIDRFLVTPFGFRECLQCYGEEVLLEMIADFQPSQEITPLFHEKLLSWSDRYLRIGGLPEVILADVHQEDFKRVRSSILLSQKDDFIRKERFDEAYLFLDALKGVANNLGFPSKSTHVASSYDQARKVLEVLGQWHLLVELEQKGVASTTAFHPKRYLYDIGIAQQLRAMPFPEISMLNTLDKILRSQLGGLFENLVLLALLSSVIDQSQLSGWRKDSTGGAEVDFIWQNDTPIPIEVKSQLKVTPRSFSSLRTYLDLTGQKFGVLITAAPFSIMKNQQHTLVNLPIYLADTDIIERLAQELV